MSSPAALVGRGLLAVGTVAAGVALGALAERSLVRRAARGPVEDYGALHSEPIVVETADGSTLHVEVDEADAGNSDVTIVFCHGYALNLDSWHYQRQGLRGSARLVLYDQRSHGRSGRAGADTHSLDQLGDDLATVIAAVVPTGPLILVGHSMGGMTIMAFARDHVDLVRERVYGVALIATAASGLDREVLGLPPVVGRAVLSAAPALTALAVRQRRLVERARWADSDIGILLTRLYSFGSNASEQMGRFVASMLSSTAIDVVADYLPALSSVDLVDGLESLQGAEVLVIAGDRDRMTPRERSDEIVSHIPGAEYVVMLSSGHMVALERSVEVNALLRGLLDRVRRNLAASGSAA